jgi:hypothetical protein
MKLTDGFDEVLAETLNGLLEEKVNVTKDLISQLQSSMSRDTGLKAIRISGRGEQRPKEVRAEEGKKFNPYGNFKDAMRKKRDWKANNKEVK